MGYLLNEKKLVNDNVFLYEEKLNSKLIRFLEKTPTFVTYFNINDTESTVDLGFQNVEKILGKDSPVRFNEIKDFPIYGLDQIILSLNDENQGLDSSYDGEAIILPGTISPYPNDFFYINHLDRNYLFMVTEVNYDTIKSNNFYKISFTLKSIDEESFQNLNEQVTDKYNCILNNIGTKEKAIIKSEELDMVIYLNDVYKLLANFYLSLFFDKKYNTFILNDGNKIYDSFLLEFINKYELFNEKGNYSTLLFRNEDRRSTFRLEYLKSIYTDIENKEFTNKLLTFSLENIYDPSSVFIYYRDFTVKSIRFKDIGQFQYFNNNLIDSITQNNTDSCNALEKIIVKYFNNKLNKFSDFELNNLKKIENYLDYNFDCFIQVPIVLYIMKSFYNNFMTSI